MTPETTRPQPAKLLSMPVAIAFCLLGTLAFATMATNAYHAYRLSTAGAEMTAMVTHKWRASQWDDDHYIGYAYVDEEGVEHRGSARIDEESQSFYTVGEPVQVMIDTEVLSRSALVDSSHLSAMERASGSWPMVIATGVVAILSWYLLINRLRRSWSALRRPRS